MICSATAFHSPEHLVVAVLSSEQNLAHWDWVKWLPHAQSAQQSDAVGPMRMVSTSLDDLAALLPPDLSERPRFGADERPATPHILLVIDGGELPPGNHVVPPDGLHGVTLLDLPARWDELEDATRLRLQFERRAEPATAATRCRRCGCARSSIRAKVDQCALATAEAFARRLTPLHTVERRGRAAAARETGGDADFMELLALGDVHRFDPDAGLAAAARARPAAGADRHRRRRRRRPPRHQGVRPAGHGPARPGDRRDRLRQVGVPAHAGARAGDDALARAAQHGARRLQGRRDVRRHVRAAARLGGDHQPGPGAHPRRPHAGRAVRRDGAPPGAAPRGRQLRLDPRLREGPRRPARTSRRCRRCSSWSTSSPRCSSAKPEFIDLFVAIGRLGRSLGLHLLLASQRLEEGRLRGLESHLSYRVGLRTFSAAGVPRGARRPRRLRAARRSRASATSSRTRPRCCGSRRPTSPGRRPAGCGYAATRAASSRASCRSRSPRCSSSTSRSTSRSPSRRRSSTGDQESLLDIAVDHMVGHGPAAHQVWLPPLDVPDTLDQLMPDLAVGPAARPGVAGVARARRPRRTRSAPWTGRASSAATPSRST